MIFGCVVLNSLVLNQFFGCVLLNSPVRYSDETIFVNWQCQVRRDILCIVYSYSEYKSDLLKNSNFASVRIFLQLVLILFFVWFKLHVVFFTRKGICRKSEDILTSGEIRTNNHQIRSPVLYSSFTAPPVISKIIAVKNF